MQNTIHQIMSPTISVCITTYNHEKFLAQALDSVLMQQGNFTLEILVGEDGSADKTPEIVCDYKRRYPETIRAFFHDPTDKLFVNGRQTGRKNFMNNLVHAQGQYVALLDGDDYWLDSRKLEKQVEFLEKNKGYVACCHAAINVDENGGIVEGYMGHHDVGGHYRDFSLHDVMRKNPVPTLSVLFRNPHFSTFPALFLKTDMADWPLHMLNALRGDIRYFDEKMAAYRVHGAGAWAGFRASAEKTMLSEITVWRFVAEDPVFAEHAAYIRGLIINQYSKLAKISLREKNFSKAWKYLGEKYAAGCRWHDPAAFALGCRIVRKQLQRAILPGRSSS